MAAKTGGNGTATKDKEVKEGAKKVAKRDGAFTMDKAYAQKESTKE